MLQEKERPVKPVTQVKERIPFEQNNLPFEIRTIDWMEKNRQQNQAPHRHSYYEITWITEGEGIYFVDLEKFEIAGSGICCASPGQVHQLKIRERTKGYVISFNSDILLLAQNQSGAASSPKDTVLSQGSMIRLSADTSMEMEHLMQQMIREFDNFFLLRTEILMGFFKIFLIYMARQSEEVGQAAPQTRSADLVKKFFTAMEKKFITHKKVTEYAEHLAVTPNYLNEIVKKVSGFSASYHIQQRIVLEAKRHATYSNSSMKEIAYHLGFDDIAHFSKFFKNVSGQSFTDFKKQVAYQFGRSALQA
jgi:AraC-like DNA-binding protein